MNFTGLAQNTECSLRFQVRHKGQNQFDTTQWTESRHLCILPQLLDREELLRIRRGILNDAKINQKSVLRFKADSYTYLDVYAHGKNKLKTSMYSCGGKSDLKCSTLLLEGAMCTRREGCPRCYPCCIELMQQDKLS